MIIAIIISSLIIIGLIIVLNANVVILNKNFINFNDKFRGYISAIAEFLNKKLERESSQGDPGV